MNNNDFTLENLKQVNVCISEYQTNTQGVSFELTEKLVNGNHWCYWFTNRFINGGECTFILRNKNAAGLRIRSESWSDNAWLYFTDWSLSKVTNDDTIDVIEIESGIIYVRIQIPAMRDEHLCIGLMFLKDIDITDYLGFGQSVKIEKFQFRNHSDELKTSRKLGYNVFSNAHSRNDNFGRKAFELCKGKGLEIGALHKPFDLDAELIYLDRDHTEVLRNQYKNDPRVNDIQQVQIVWNSPTYPFFDDNAFDFVINSHVLEHVTNPGRQIEEWMRIVTPGGILYMVVPDKNYCFDRRRATTSTEHLIQEFKNNVDRTTIEHYRDFILNTQGEDGINRNISEDFIYSCYEQQSSIHVHTFTAKSLKDFLTDLQRYVQYDIVHYDPQGLNLHCALKKIN